MRIMPSFEYPADFQPSEEGGFVITFPDVPEAITQGETVDDGVEQAADALEEAVATRAKLGLAMPPSSSLKAGQHLISVPSEPFPKSGL